MDIYDDEEVAKLNAQRIADYIDHQIFMKVRSFTIRKNSKRRRLRRKWTMGKSKLIIGFHPDLEKNIMQHLLEEIGVRDENLG